MTKAAAYGVIDVGSHSVLLLVARPEGDGTLTVLSERAEITRLGEGLDRSGLLGEKAVDRTLSVMQEYREECRRLGANCILAVGTSAMRRASNTDILQKMARDLLGIPIQVISGEEEARLTFLSIAASMPEEDLETIVVDIGGGSTEFVTGRDRKIREAKSLDLGAVSLTEEYLHSDPPAPEEYVKLSERVKAALVKLPDPREGETMVGVAGTVTTLAAIEKGMENYNAEQIEWMRLTMPVIAEQIRMFRSMTLAERKKIPGLRPERAEVILAGAEILRRSMIRYDVEEMRVSTKGVRYGILFEELNRVSQTAEGQRG